MLKLLFSTCVLALTASSVFAAAPTPTFSRDVAPILNARCVTCHRSGEAAPMSLRTYAETRPWARAIKQKVASREMPPWHAEAGVNRFSNDRRLTDKEVATVVAWVDGGAPEGKRADLPAPPQFTEGWGIGTPDRIVDTGVDFTIPANGVVPYQYFDVDPGFTVDTWVQAVEVRPTQRAQVHHILVFVQPPGGPGRGAGLLGALFGGGPPRGGGPGGGRGGPDGQGRGGPGGPGGRGGPGGAGGPQPGEQFRNMLIGYAPGVPTLAWDNDTAFLVKAGSHFLFQVHYTVNGTASSDRSVLGLKLRTDSPKFRAHSGSAMQMRLAIPPHDPNYQVQAAYTFQEDATVLDVTPHMHLRGKAFKYVLTYPDGRTEVLLNVPKYAFDWQLSYVLAEPRHVPAGSRLDVTAWYDNSATNKANPDPSQTVRWGDQTFEEMMIGFFNYKVPADRPEPAGPPR